MEKTGDKATFIYVDRILLYAVPPLSRESRCVKHDPGRSPDFRSFGAACKPKPAIQNSAVPSHQFDSGFLSGYFALFSLAQEIIHSGGAVADFHRASLFSVTRHLNRWFIQLLWIYYIILLPLLQVFYFSPELVEDASFSRQFRYAL